MAVDIGSLVQRFWARMNENDWAAAAEVFSENFVFTWPQSSERILSRADFAAINTCYPANGRWSFTIDRFVVSATTAVTEVHVTDGTIHATAITFFESDGNGLSRITEYWPDPFPAPAWRSAWVEVAGAGN